MPPITSIAIFIVLCAVVCLGLYINRLKSRAPAENEPAKSEMPAAKESHKDSRSEKNAGAGDVSARNISFGVFIESENGEFISTENGLGEEDGSSPKNSKN